MNSLKIGTCYKECNKEFGATQPAERIFCKKGCDADDDTL